MIEFHKQHGKLATITSVSPPGRYGVIEMHPGTFLVEKFSEKPKGDGGIINGGFFVLSPQCINYIINDTTVWESEPLIKLANENELMAFNHDGFWHPMDTLRDKNYLEELWVNQKASWKTWK